MTYNGWSNWETWNVNLWIDNDEGTYHNKIDFIDTMNGNRRGKLSPPEEVFRNEVYVEDFCRKIFPNGTQDMDDVSEMDKVDWSELCESWMEEKIESETIGE